MEHIRRPNPKYGAGVRRLLSLLLLILALNAFGGGIYGMAGAASVPVSWLRHTPFSSYFLPGLILFAVIGLTALRAAVCLFRGSPRGRHHAILAGLLTLGWIFVQLLLIGYVSWLQPFIVILSLVILLLTRFVDCYDT
jgi:hypothetical protein